MPREWIPDHWWTAFVNVWRKICRDYGNRRSPQASHWWNAFVKAWRKIGNVYQHKALPPANYPGCEGFVRPDHAPLVPRPPSILPLISAAELPRPELLIDRAPVDLVARSCASKRRYSSEDLANTVAVHCWQDRGVRLRIYACGVCGGFHLTRSRAEPRMQEGWRPPRVSERQQNIARKRQRKA